MRNLQIGWQDLYIKKDEQHKICLRSLDLGLFLCEEGRENGYLRRRFGKIV